MYCTILRLGLAVGPDIHVHFVSCEEMRKKHKKREYLLFESRTLQKNISEDIVIS